MDNIEKIYRLLSLELVDLARKKNCDRDFNFRAALWDRGDDLC